MRERKRVVLVNAWHDDNKGDSAITEGTLRILQLAFEKCGVEPDFTVVGLSESGRLAATATRHVSASWPDARTLPIQLPTELRSKAAARPLVDVPVWLVRLVPSVAATMLGRTPSGLRGVLHDADILVVVGGSNLHDSESVHPLASAARLYTLSAAIPAAVKAGIPVLLLGHTLGPFPARRRLTTEMARRMIGIADLAVVREAESVPVAEELGIAQIELAPDMAFALQPIATRRVIDIVETLPVPAGQTAVIAVRQHPSLGPDADRRINDELVAAIGGLYDNGHLGAVMVVSHTIGPTPIEDDRGPSRVLAEKLRDRYPDLPVVYLQEDLAPAELAWLYGQMACMIAVRLHAAILAMLMGTPTFAIAYFTHKTTGVMSAVGLPDCVGEYATVRGSDIIGALSPRIGSAEARHALAAVCAANREQLETRCSAWVADHVLESGAVDRWPA